MRPVVGGIATKTEIEMGMYDLVDIVRANYQLDLIEERNQKIREQYGNNR